MNDGSGKREALVSASREDCGVVQPLGSGLSCPVARDVIDSGPASEGYPMSLSHAPRRLVMSQQREVSFA